MTRGEYSSSALQHLHAQAYVLPHCEAIRTAFGKQLEAPAELALERRMAEFSHADVLSSTAHKSTANTWNIFNS